jgi:AcrR family transcriptional regulator
VETEEKIIRAARRQFEERGFSAATTKAIAADAGVAEVTLFRIFGDKQTLFIRMLRTIVGEFGLTLVLDEMTGDFQNDIHALCQSLLRQFIRYNALFCMLIFEAKQHEYIRLVMQEVRGRSLQNMRAMTVRYTGAADVPADALECIGCELMGASLSYCVFHSGENEEEYVRTYAGMIADAFLRQTAAMKE